MAQQRDPSTFEIPVGKRIDMVRCTKNQPQEYKGFHGINYKTFAVATLIFVKCGDDFLGDIDR